MALGLNGCATYSGAKPDFSQKDQTSADAEYKKFELSESYFRNNGEILTTEKDGVGYSLSSIKPLLQDVSPGAKEKAEIAQDLNIFGWLFWAGAVGAILSNSSPAVKNASWVLLAGSVALWEGGRAEMQAAAMEYNHDLRSKLTPKVTLNFNY
jgi:hypothetical protein